MYDCPHPPAGGHCAGNRTGHVAVTVMGASKDSFGEFHPVSYVTFGVSLVVIGVYTVDVFITIIHHPDLPIVINRNTFWGGSNYDYCFEVPIISVTGDCACIMVGQPHISVVSNCHPTSRSGRFFPVYGTIYDIYSG